MTPAWARSIRAFCLALMSAGLPPVSNRSWASLSASFMISSPASAATFWVTIAV